MRKLLQIRRRNSFRSSSSRAASFTPIRSQKRRSQISIQKNPICCCVSFLVISLVAFSSVAGQIKENRSVSEELVSKLVDYSDVRKTFPDYIPTPKESQLRFLALKHLLVFVRRPHIPFGVDLQDYWARNEIKSVTYLLHRIDKEGMVSPRPYAQKGLRIEFDRNGNTLQFEHGKQSFVLHRKIVYSREPKSESCTITIGKYVEKIVLSRKGKGYSLEANNRGQISIFDLDEWGRVIKCTLPWPAGNCEVIAYQKNGAIESYYNHWTNRNPYVNATGLKWNFLPNKNRIPTPELVEKDPDETVAEHSVEARRLDNGNLNVVQKFHCGTFGNYLKWVNVSVFDDKDRLIFFSDNSDEETGYRIKRSTDNQPTLTMLTRGRTDNQVINSRQVFPIEPATSFLSEQREANSMRLSPHFLLMPFDIKVKMRNGEINRIEASVSNDRYLLKEFDKTYFE